MSAILSFVASIVLFVVQAPVELVQQVLNPADSSTNDIQAESALSEQEILEELSSTGSLLTEPSL